LICYEAAYALQGDRERFLELEMDAYTSKPIHMEELYELMETAGNTVDDTKNKSGIHAEDETILFRQFMFKSELNELELNLKVMETSVGYQNADITGYMVNEIFDIADKIHSKEIKGIASRMNYSLKRGGLEEVKTLIDTVRSEIQTLRNVAK
jgi:CheY-like chemotaxis protein